jgi:transposase
MIDYSTYCQIKALQQEHFTAGQIADRLELHPQTVSKWMKRPKYLPRQHSCPRKSKLDPYKAQIIAWLDADRLSGAQILARLRKQGYQGGHTILDEYIRQIRPKRKKAFLTLSFDPGQCGQIDWGSAGSIGIEGTRRKLSFFLMVLGYSRMMYVEFTLAQTMEHFLGSLKNAFEYFGACPRQIMVDNMKTAVLSHPMGQKPVFHPRFLDFAHHYGFEPVACNVRSPQEKGRVENGVGYVKKNFLNGIQRDQFTGINLAAHEWMNEIANVRTHGQTKKRPVDLMQDEKAQMIPLPIHPYDIGVQRIVCANSQFRVIVDTNRYSVPSEYSGRRITLKSYPDRLVFFDQDKIIAEHPRRYGRNGNYLILDHQRELLRHRRKARDQQLLMHMLRISSQSDSFYKELQSRRLNPAHHVRKIVALTEIYGNDAVGQAIEDAVTFGAFSSEYITNILEQRARILPEPGALYLTHRRDVLDLELPEPDLSIYDPKNESYDEGDAQNEL